MMGSLLRHFPLLNSRLCELCGAEVEILRHFLFPRCLKLQERAGLLFQYMNSIVQVSTTCLNILENVILGSSVDQDVWVQFVLDCSVFPQVIASSQCDKTVLPLLFKVTRTWCYSLHRTRLKILGRWS